MELYTLQKAVNRGFDKLIHHAKEILAEAKEVQAIDYMDAFSGLDYVFEYVTMDNLSYINGIIDNELEDDEYIEGISILSNKATEVKEELERIFNELFELGITKDTLGMELSEINITFGKEASEIIIKTIETLIVSNTKLVTQ